VSPRLNGVAWPVDGARVYRRRLTSCFNKNFYLDGVRSNPCSLGKLLKALAAAGPRVDRSSLYALRAQVAATTEPQRIGRRESNR
jgi:hypothetical protein